MEKSLILTKENNLIKLRIYNYSANDFKETIEYERIKDIIIYLRDVKKGFTPNMLGDIYPYIKSINPNWDGEIISNDDIISISFTDDNISSEYLIEHLNNIFETWI